MDILQKIKNNQFKVSQLEKVTIETMGIEEETEKAVKLVFLTTNGEPKSKWVPKSVIIPEGEKNQTIVKGWFAAKELFPFVNRKYFI